MEVKPRCLETRLWRGEGREGLARARSFKTLGGQGRECGFYSHGHKISLESSSRLWGARAEIGGPKGRRLLGGERERLIWTKGIAAGGGEWEESRSEGR